MCVWRQENDTFRSNYAPRLRTAHLLNATFLFSYNFFPLHISFLFTVRPYISQISSAVQTGETKCIKKDLCHTRTFPDSPFHLCLCFPLSISFLCTFLSSLGSALIYHRFPLQSRLERRSVLKRICAIPGPSRTVGFTSVYAFLLAIHSSAPFFPLKVPPLSITDFLCSPPCPGDVC